MPSASFSGKMLFHQHMQDTAVWPCEAVAYERAIRDVQGDDAEDRFCLRLVDHAEHGWAAILPAQPGAPAPVTAYIDYRGMIEQGLADVMRWVEEGIRPAGTTYSYADGRVTLPPAAGERGGIQPVAHATANGSARAEVKAGEPVVLEVAAELPPGAGTIIAVEWDFDGTGTWPYVHHGIDGTATTARVAVTHAYDHAGTYFPSVRITSHRDGDLTATYRRIENLARARVVVSAG
jgi:hypothetical protein